MNLKLENLHPDFAASAQGIDIAQPLSKSDVNEIKTALEHYGVLLFRGQRLNEDLQIRLAQSFGELDTGFKKASKSPSRLKYDALLDMSNVGTDDNLVDRTHQKIVGNIANQLWHSDSSFQKPGSAFSMLHAVILTEEGGETEFVDCRIAYETLPETLQRQLEGMRAKHHALYSRAQLGDENYNEEQRRAIPAVDWPVLRRQASSGRRSLFIGAHANEIIGMTVPEGRMLLLDLLEHATRPERIYRHQWQVDDLVMWDNRVTLHRGRRFDFSQRRELRRTTTLDPDSMAAYGAAA